MDILLNLVNEGTTALNEYITVRLKKMGNGTLMFEKQFFSPQFTPKLTLHSKKEKSCKLYAYHHKSQSEYLCKETLT